MRHDKLIDDFADYLRYERNYSAYTVGAYFKDLCQFEEYVRSHQDIEDEADGKFFPGEVDRDIVRNWIASLMDEKLSPRSVNRKLRRRSLYLILLRTRIWKRCWMVMDSGMILKA